MILRRSGGVAIHAFGEFRVIEGNVRPGYCIVAQRALQWIVVRRGSRGVTDYTIRKTEMVEGHICPTGRIVTG